MASPAVAKSYKAETVEQQQAAYDEWANEYEADLCRDGNRIPQIVSTIFTHFIDKDTAPILDAGCGGGIQAEPLALLGYGPIIGMDLSEGMLEVARKKGFYSELHRMTMGETLGFETNQFAATLCSGCITPRHAPPHSLDELIRVTRPGGLLIFSMRDDDSQEPEYYEALERLDASGLWEPVFKTEKFQSMPYGEATVRHRVHVYKIL